MVTEGSTGLDVVGFRDGKIEIPVGHAIIWPHEKLYTHV